MRKAILFNQRTYVQRLLLSAVIAIGCLQTSFSQDCPPLTVFCQDLNTSFMPDACMVEVWAKDFINKINDANTSLDDFIISFEEDREVMNRVFESVGGDSYEVTIWITSRCDPSLQTRCIVNLDINDNTGNCPTEPCPIRVNEWCGFGVVTCSTIQETPNEFTGHTAAIVDLRKNSRAPRGDNWTEPLDASADVLQYIRPEAWRVNNIGNVFGIALQPNNGRIFLAASDIYDFDFQQFVTVGPPPPSVTGRAGAAGIYQTNFKFPETIGPLISTRQLYPIPANFDRAIIGKNLIPNTGNLPQDSTRSGNGIGNIDHDLRSNHLYASNLEDGKLYSINIKDKIITDVYDPFEAYVHIPGMVKHGERIWGVAVSDCGPVSRLFFARGSRNPSMVPDLNEPKEIWSIALNIDGTFEGTPRIEFIDDNGDQDKITDLAFNASCDEILLAERGNAHSSEVNRYIRLADGSWQHQNQVFVGINDVSNVDPSYPDGIVGNSATGGVSFGPAEENCVVDARCEGLVWSTINCGDVAADDGVDPLPFECRVYGLQGSDVAGNSLATSKTTDIFASLDTVDVDFSFRLKSNIGEIEIFNCCCPFEEGRHVLGDGASAMVAGEVYTENNIRVRETNISITSQGMQDQMMTNVTGEYMFEELSMHADYNITPSKSGDISDGLSTGDLVLIQRHILGLRSLGSPYKIIAADLNGDHKVAASDLVTMRRIILGSANQSELEAWTFVPKSHQFANPSRPFPFAKTIVLGDLEENTMHEDFIAIKRGDVNGDNTIAQTGLSRSLRAITLQVNIIDNIAHVSLNQDIDLSGLQFELTSESILQGTKLSDGIISLDNQSYISKDGSLKLSWASNSDVSIKKGQTLFTFAIAEGDNNEIALQQEKIVAEAYNENVEAYQIVLNSTIFSDQNELIGNSPNPFSDETLISFNLTEDQNVSFLFYNSEGKLIHNIDRAFNKGRNNLKVTADQLNGVENSIVFYKMVAKGFASTGKLVLLK